MVLNLRMTRLVIVIQRFVEPSPGNACNGICSVVWITSFRDLHQRLVGWCVTLFWELGIHQGYAKHWPNI
jgi:hypothetical protein